MAAEVGRDEAIALLDQGYRETRALLGGLSAGDITRRATIGAGEWSAQDLLGHIAFWEELAIQTITEWRVGSRPDVEGILAAGARGTDEANARNQELTNEQPLQEVHRRADASHHGIVEAIRNMSDDEWRAEPPYTPAVESTLGKLLGSVLGGPRGDFLHAFEHMSDLQAYVESLPER